MKRFEKPKMAIVHLSNEDINIITTSPCNDKLCHGYDCPDCPTQCDGIYHCEIFKCTHY